MTETSSFREQTPANKPLEQKSESFPILQRRLVDIPNGDQLFNQISNNLSKLPPSTERIKIETTLRSVDDDMLDEDILTLLKRVEEDVIEKQKKQLESHSQDDVVRISEEEDVIEKQKKQTEKDREQTNADKKTDKLIDNKATEKDNKATEKDNKEIEIREKNDLAKKRIDALYEAFGGETEFNARNKDFGGWKEKVRTELIKDPKFANDPELETKVLLLTIQRNQDQIDKSSEDLPQKLKEKYNSQKLFRDIKSSLVDLKVPYILLSLPRIAPPIDLLGYKKGDQVTRTGNEFKFGDQVIDISTRPPTRSIESNGIRVTFDKTEKKEQNYRDQEKYRESRGDLTREIASLTKDISEGREGMQEKYRLLRQMKDDYKAGPEGSEEQKGLKGLIEKTEKELEDFKKKTEILAKLQSALVALDAAEALRAHGYQESLKSETEASRSNLKFLESTNLTGLLGDSGIKFLIEQINEQKNTLKPGSAKLNLQTRFEDSDKELLALGIKKLLGLDPKEIASFFEPNGFDMKQTTEPPILEKIKQKLESNGTYGGTPPTINRENIQKVISGRHK